ncbi:2,4-dienoyl-CoA reductase-like NADH-dependent reductase (Old Yellow Enzyme family) [Nocardioides ginsengisegetis]|uniref:2,4-dienoyl-CoA reductase-like NADH-dependent reductase (Old Yellow Enzyme family) n=1 Tax=Nocardioides ginsengisegetis TaxID=661491 RepID=A0A7W3PAF1_9ACTN|nr:alkene reductase [Nocardioides ginsengisegetis]MBA8804449.1 2,4-dienoyl-CoA reductase-like NADH-dependent reductase (Old Yellow Enzyme family) [Nocardioides ginsengisegetis]
MADLFEDLQTPAWRLRNRLVMAPLTRNRADAGGVPGDLAVEYYGQRATAGLIVTEGTQPSAVGQGYPNTPGLHSAEQVAGWSRVAEAVHDRGGRIVAQLMHAGRVSHPDNTGGLGSIAPSALAAPGEMFTPTGPKPHPVPRALETDEIAGVVEEFVQAARNAVEAGLDGVEVHAANGYLIHQFLAPGSNERTDQYGGSPEGRARFAIEVTRAVAEAIGPDRVGIRISPAHNIQGATEEDPADVEATYGALVEAIAPLGLAYLSVLADPRQDLVQRLRKDFGGVFVVNDGFGSITTREDAQAILDDDLGDAVAVGRLFLANPDLPRRWETGAELNEPNPATFYGGGAEGYTDYPTLD